jgi:hypothetical protein
MLILLALALGAVAVAYVVMNKPSGLSAGATREAPLACPSCGSFVSARAKAGAIVRCEACTQFAIVEPTGLLGTVPADHVATDHVFQAYMPETVRWPNACCLCCQPATRTQKMALTYTVDAEPEDRMTAALGVAMFSVGTMALTSMTEKVTERINVPHCDAHQDGARMVQAGIQFRSYRDYQQFVQQNRATFGV